MDLSRYFLAWRTTLLRDREVIDALVDPVHAAPSPGLTQELKSWRGTWYWSDEHGIRHLVLTRPRRRVPERWWLHVALFLATLFTASFAGAGFAGTLPSVNWPWEIVRGFSYDAAFWRAWSAGLVFGVPLVLILVSHELGHYLTARRYDLDASPPYFLPFPGAIVGTVGAFIRLRTLLSDRRQLLDVGIAGPIAGFVVAVPALVIGLHLSQPLVSLGFHGMVVAIPGIGDRVVLGDSLTTLALRALLFGSANAVRLHPLAFAGVFGIFVTMINLMPIAQLDGGHILYAVRPRAHRPVAIGVWLALLVLGHWWGGWYIWATFVLLVSRARFEHPPVLDAYRPLPASRRRLGWVGFVLLLVTFAPMPFQV
jgi:membrane-associated protease RseP (regulator of RpoE activity)